MAIHMKAVCNKMSKLTSRKYILPELVSKYQLR